MHHAQPNTSRVPMPGHPLTKPEPSNLVALIRRDPRAARGLDAPVITRGPKAGN